MSGICSRRAGAGRARGGASLLALFAIACGTLSVSEEQSLGSQMAGLFPKPKYDGVLGLWYGKAPGVDRTGDVFKHANYAGVGKNGGVLALAGDDPSCKSSTVASSSEATLFDALMRRFPDN